MDILSTQRHENYKLYIFKIKNSEIADSQQTDKTCLDLDSEGRKLGSTRNYLAKHPEERNFLACRTDLYMECAGH